MIAPAIVACFLSTPYWEVSFVSEFDNPRMPIRETFSIIFGDSWQYVWPVVVISILQIVGATLIMSAMDKHFRTGTLSIRMPLRLLNNTIFPITVGVIVMSVISILWRFALFGLVSLVQVIARAVGFPPELTLALIALVSVVLFFFHVLVITPILFWAPTMFIYGYRFRDAAAMSFQLISGKKVFRGLIVPLIACAGVQILVGFVNDYYAVAVAVNFVIYLATNVYASAYVMIAFYSISEIDRRDIKPYEALPPIGIQVKQDQEKEKDKKKKGKDEQKSAEKEEEEKDVV